MTLSAPDWPLQVLLCEQLAADGLDALEARTLRHSVAQLSGHPGGAVLVAALERPSDRSSSSAPSLEDAGYLLVRAALRASTRRATTRAAHRRLPQGGELPGIAEHDDRHVRVDRQPLRPATCAWRAAGSTSSGPTRSLEAGADHRFGARARRSPWRVAQPRVARGVAADLLAHGQHAHLLPSVRCQA